MNVPTAVPLGPPALLMLTGDLLFASRASHQSQACGLRFILQSAAAAKEPFAAERLGDWLPCPESVVLVVLDVQSRSEWVDKLVPIVRPLFPAARLLAFGPHVQRGTLERARQEGFDLVLTRGQFDRELENFPRFLEGLEVSSKGSTSS